MANPHRDQVLKTAMELQPLLIAYLVGMVHGMDAAEDVFQDVIVVICEKWPEVPLQGNVHGWCMEIARRTALDWLRKNRRGPAILREETLAQLAHDPAWAEQIHQDALPLEALQRCMARLSEQTRELLKLRYSQNLSLDSIARKIQRPVESLYVSLSRARMLIRECVSQQIKGTVAP